MTAVMTFPPTPSVSPSSASVLADAAPPLERAKSWMMSSTTNRSSNSPRANSGNKPIPIAAPQIVREPHLIHSSSSADGW